MAGLALNIAKMSPSNQKFKPYLVYYLHRDKKFCLKYKWALPDFRVNVERTLYTGPKQHWALIYLYLFLVPFWRLTRSIDIQFSDRSKIF